jgi:cysteine desulfuration protein SufE
VWLHSEIEGDVLSFTADSDAILTKGIVALLLRVLNNQKPKDILDCELFFVDEIGLKEHLSPTRANGLVSMIKQLKLYALAFQSKLS